MPSRENFIARLFKQGHWPALWFPSSYAMGVGNTRGVWQVFQKVILEPSGPSTDFLWHYPYLVHMLAAQGSLGSASQTLAFLKWRER